MKRKISMSCLIDSAAEPFASFHDATLSNIHIDYDQRTLSAEFELSVGNPDGTSQAERERTRRAHLNLSDLILWGIEAPDNRDVNNWGPLWLVHDCIMEEATTEKGKELSITLGPDVYAWCMFFSDINAFGYCAAKEATFEWK